jgi:hypothetical protein
MIATNRERLAIQSVMGEIHHPTLSRSGAQKIGSDGSVWVLPSVGGISYNVKIGDSVYGMLCDHLEPGVSIKNPDASQNEALMALACVGNEAKVVSGDAKGAVGFVTGFHGGIDHTLLYFGKEDLEKMLPGDRVLIKAQGQGLALKKLPEIRFTGIDPALFERLDPVVEGGRLKIKVAAVIPPHLLGAGQGMGNAWQGDFDLMTADWDEIKRFGLDRLRYGDLVLLEDCDHTLGRGFLRGAVSVGIIVHSDCVLTGHGPGITTLMSCKKPLIAAETDKNANLADIML